MYIFIVYCRKCRKILSKHEMEINLEFQLRLSLNDLKTIVSFLFKILYIFQFFALPTRLQISPINIWNDSFRIVFIYFF